MPLENPYPGMNPYLENHWGDIHQRLITYACDQIQFQLPGRLRARVEERVFLESNDDTWSRNVYPDARVYERPSGFDAPGTPLSGVAVAEPLIIDVDQHEEMTEGFIEIRDGQSGNRVITVIEVLSFANKAGGEGARLYKQKQGEVVAADASLVEIDLLPDGKRVFAIPPGLMPPSRETQSMICVTRSWHATRKELYVIPLREKLPAIRIPLRRTDPDVLLDLLALIDQAYRMGRYDDIDYEVNPQPRLSPDESLWSEQLLQGKALRRP